jgi:predicted secreted protein
MQLRGIRYIFFAALLLGGFWYAKTLMIQSAHVIALTDDSADKTLTIKKGQIFTLTLPRQTDGGYRFDSIQYTPSIVTLQKHTAKPPPPGSPAGRAGTGTWQFIARATGHTIIKVTATRPWKGGGTVTVFKNEIVVR